MVTVSRQTGFTLIEVMVVVVIVGILAAIGIPNFLRYRAHAMQAEARSNLAVIFVAETAYCSTVARCCRLPLLSFTMQLFQA